MDEDEIRAQFLIEAKDHIASVEDDVLALERCGAEVDKDLVNRLFRAMHTVKGGSSFFEMKAVTTLAHELENLMGLIRDGKLIPNPEIAETLLKGIDRLKTLLSNPDQDAGADVPALLEEVKAVQTPGAAKDKASAVPEAPGKALFDLKHYPLKNFKPEYTFLCEATVDLFKEGREKNVTLSDILREMRLLGTIVDAKLAPAKRLDDPMPGTFPFSFLLATRLDDPEFISYGIQATPIHLVLTPLDQAIASVKTAIPAQAPVQEKTEPLIPIKKSVAAAPVAPAHPEEAKKADASLRVALTLLDKCMNLTSELVLVRNQNLQALASRDIDQLAAISQRLNVVTTEMQENVMQMRMQTVGNVFNKFTRIVRDLARQINKEIVLEITGSEVELDKSIIEALGDPLTHLIRNAVDHGIESPDDRRAAKKPEAGHVHLSASHQAGHVIITIQDDGKGIDPEQLKRVALDKKIITPAQAAAMTESEAFDLIMEPGFSTAKSVTNISGRGVGMDVVKNALQKLGGLIEISSTVGKGTLFTIRLPLTLAIVPALIVSLEGSCYAIPQLNVVEIVWLHGADVYQKIEKVNNQEVYWLRGKLLPILRLSEILQIPKTFRAENEETPLPDKRKQAGDRRLDPEAKDGNKRSGPVERRTSLDNSIYIVILRLGNETFGLVVDRIVDTEEIVVKPLHEQVKECQVFAGTTILGDSRIAIVLDIAALARTGSLYIGAKETKRTAVIKSDSRQDRHSVLLFDIGGGETYAVALYLVSRVDQINAGQIQRVGDREYLNLREKTTPVIRLEQALGGVQAVYNDPLFVIIPKSIKPIGVVAARIHDSIQVSAELDTATVKHPGIIGTLLINGKMVLYTDLFHLIERIEPNWFLLDNLGPQKRKRALLLDDSPFYQSLIASYLKGFGIEVLTGSNGLEGKEIAGRETFDMVVSDIAMPVMDGYAFAEWARGQEKLRQIPLLAVSADNQKSTRNTALKAGFSDFVSKLNREELIDRLTKLCRSGA